MTLIVKVVSSIAVKYLSIYNQLTLFLLQTLYFESLYFWSFSASRFVLDVKVFV